MALIPEELNSPLSPVAPGERTFTVGPRREREFPLLDHLANGGQRLLSKHREQKAFFKFLQRASSDPILVEGVHRLRDSVIRSALAGQDQAKGVVVALTGAKGKEGTSTLSLMLALSLGACTHRRIAILDGRFNMKRFKAVSEVLSLSRNSFSIHKGASEIRAYYNQAQPNVSFLTNSGQEQGLEFFSDKQLQLFLGDLRRSFDFTIIDMPPLLKESSNVFLAPVVDQLYLVASAGKTRIEDLSRCLGVACQAGVEIEGVVLNKQAIPLWARLFWRDFFFSTVPFVAMREPSSEEDQGAS